MSRNLILLSIILFMVCFGLWFTKDTYPVGEGHSLWVDDRPLVPDLKTPGPRPSPRIQPFKSMEPHFSSKSKSLPEVDFSQKPKGNIVDFVVVNGLAISYGDIILGKVDAGESGIRGKFDAPTPGTWDKLEIPYLISPDLRHPERVERALDYLKQRTGLRFIPYSNQPDAIAFEPGSEHCYSLLGRAGGIQPIQLAEGCQSQEVLHEIMHALGFIHQQSRQDRDQFIEVLWPNIDPKFWSQYSIVPESFMEGERGFGFDYKSIMLYRPNAFAIKSDILTMRTKSDDSISPLGEGLSEGDIKRIRRLFRLE